MQIKPSRLQSGTPSSDIAAYQISKSDLRRLVIPNSARSILSLLVYIVALIVFSTIVLLTVDPFVRVGAIIGLGVIYAHGLELQHQAFHNSLFRRKTANRIVGTLLGLPMLELFVETKLQHLHHHRNVGSSEDIYDRKLAHFPTIGAFLINLFNTHRVPSFVHSLAGVLRGRYPPLCSAMAKSQVHTDYVAACAFIGLVVLTGFWAGFQSVALVWLVPWLLVAEPVHFIIGATEHLGRDERSTSYAQNSRSYRANPLWEYIANYDNYHVEHHAYPAIPAHRLPGLNRQMGSVQPVLTGSFMEAMHEVGRALVAERSARATQNDLGRQSDSHAK